MPKTQNFSFLSNHGGTANSSKLLTFKNKVLQKTYGFGPASRQNTFFFYNNDDQILQSNN